MPALDEIKERGYPVTAALVIEDQPKINLTHHVTINIHTSAYTGYFKVNRTLFAVTLGQHYYTEQYCIGALIDTILLLDLEQYGNDMHAAILDYITDILLPITYK